MDVFQRSIHSGVKKTDDGNFIVLSSLLDLEHSFHLELTVNGGTGEIIDARGEMSKAPLSKCKTGLVSIPSLAGLRIERGILKKVHARVGSTKGCAHMVELISDAIRLISMMMIGGEARYWGDNEGLSEDELVERSKPLLKNSCIVFSDDDE